nr:protein kinase-like domain, phloem protein 2-like protein [Tanacetum cinerariifolium]
MDSIMKEFEHLVIKLEEVKSATDNFTDTKIIGKGGFGNVYEGELSQLSGKTKAAFKRLDRKHEQGDPQFWKEVMMLSRYTHENVISLLGFCDDGGEKILVYEHASNGSLDRHLSSTTLTWSQRIRICHDAAKGLCYLHEDKGNHHRVLHRDIKSSNILLDENWKAKVSDMGLAKVGPTNQFTFLMTDIVEIALKSQEPIDIRSLYEEIGKAVVPPLIYRSTEEAKALFSKEVFLNGGKTGQAD